MKLPTDYTKLHHTERKSVRDEYVRIQNWLCMYCGESLDVQPPSRVTDKIIKWKYFPENFLKYPVHLQHNHTSWMTEWAVHAYCNAVMWQYHNK